METNRFFSKNSTGVALLLLIGISVLLMIPPLLYMPGRDQGMFAYAGRLVRGGSVPFRDFWDTKPPAIYYVYALSEILFGYSVHSIRWLDLFWQVGTAVVLFWIARRVAKSNGVAVAAGLLYVSAYVSRGWWNSAQPDDFLNLPVSLAVLLLMRSLDRRGICLFSFVEGMLLGMVFYFRYPMGLMLPVCMAVLLIGRGRNARAWGGCVSMVAGFAIVVAWYALYLYRAGIWGEFLYTELTWTRGYGRVGTTPHTVLGLLHLGNVFNSHFSFVSLAILALISYVWAARRGAPGLQVNFIALWILAALINLYVQNKFYIYHFAPLVAPLAIGASSALAFPFRKRYAKPIRGIVALMLALAVAIPFFKVNGRYNLYCIKVYKDSARAVVDRLLKGKALNDYYANTWFISDDFSFSADQVVAEYVKNNTGPDDTIFIWGCETSVYYLADRKNASRFIHNFPFLCDWTPPRFGDELLSDLNKNKPRLILVLRNDPAWWATGTYEDSLERLRRYPALERFIADNYAFDRGIEDFLIFRRR
ncbi:MAG: glycosyltransferase family 39 protein [bacterium]